MADMTPRLRLRAVKLVHTIIWAFLVGVIGAIWVFAAQGDRDKRIADPVTQNLPK